MYWTKRHVLVCTASHCAQKGANEVIGRLRLEIVRRGLDAEILVNNCGTIDLCDIGPNMVVYPDNVILHGVAVKDVPEIIGYLTGGPQPERLVLAPQGGNEERRRRLYADVRAAGETLPWSAFVNIVTAHGFDETWIAEQQRRGFVARKPGDPEETATVTKKARDRYGLVTGSA